MEQLSQLIESFQFTGSGMTDSALSGVRWSDLYNVTSIEVNSTSLTTLAPLTNMSGLTSIRAQYNSQLSSLGTLNNPNLTVINMGGYGEYGDEAGNSLTSAGIASVNWSRLTMLKELYLAHNKLTDISPLTDMPSLSILDVTSNQIETLGRLNNPSLTKLWIGFMATVYDYNQKRGNRLTSAGIATVNWANLTKLEMLFMDDNRITDISPITNLPSLRVLYAAGNQIDTLGRLNNPKLETLYLGYASGTDGYGNKLTSSSLSTVTWSSLTHLTTVDLARNQIGDISPMTNMPVLRDLDARYNKITNLGSLNNPNIVTLNLLNNELPANSLFTVTWSNLTKLVKLTLDSNYIADISPLTNMSSLSELSVENNNVSTLGSLNNPNLTTLGLGRGYQYKPREILGNRLTSPSLASVNWSALTKLSALFLDSNQITDISLISNLPALARLNAADNQISVIGALANPKLTDLSLENNKLTGNCLSTVSWTILQQSLKLLVLTHNRITDISPITGMTKLTRLDASDNNISKLGALENPALTEVHLTGNNLTGESLAGVNWAILGTSLTLLNMNQNHIIDISKVDWSKLTKIVYSGYLGINSQTLVLPTMHNYSDNPMVLGPAIVKHSPDTFATPTQCTNWQNNQTIDCSTPTGGSYNTGNGEYSWAHSYPGTYKYPFTATVALPSGVTTPFEGIITRGVDGFTVTFDPNGGILHTPAVVPVSGGGPVAEPNPAPTMSGGKFLGWYTQSWLNTKWDFSQNVSSNMTLYARWAPDFSLPKAGAIPLQRLGGGTLLVLSLLTALTLAAHQMASRRSHPGKHTQISA
ncbi:leucine-rich repeat domain-containing protein [Bifidobacterium xylocopae]|uniref:Uncharacterized protein n=1 Tax=Bifidobacterium xylocopae TaxID=2493119 RepID=A0A366KCC5_9BIFI|nr:leucine-rich repeat domain-containing protein [Bifidobacterium xylocopae]RBP99219.1 hypothetical protein CRD59_04880 [Bifidobacterium xylocopae]